MRQAFLGQRVSLGIILFLALAVRLLGISSRPLWYDEAFAVLFAEKGPQAMVYGTLAPDAGLGGGAAADVHPLAYYSLLCGWMELFASSPVAVRLLSVLAGLGVVLLVYLLGRAMFGGRTALFAAGLAALAPFQIHYAQEVRMYALLAFLLLVATWALWQSLQTKRWLWWLLFAFAAAMAQYTHNLAAFYLVPLAITPLVLRRKRETAATAFAGMGALLLYLPWLVRVPEQFNKVHQSYWTAPPSPARLITALLSYVTNLPLPDSWLPLALFITLLCIILAAWGTIRAVRSGFPRARRGLWLAYLAFSPLLLLFTFSQWQPVFIERALLPSGAVFLLWIAWAFTQTGLPKGIQYFAAACLVMGMLGGVYQHLTYRGFPYADYAGLTAYLEKNLAPGDIVVHSNKLSMLPAVYYNQDLPQKFIADPPGSGADTLALPTQHVLGLIADSGPENAVGKASRVWFLVFDRAVKEYETLGYSGHPHLNWMEANFHTERVETWGDLRLYVYTRSN